MGGDPMFLSTTNLSDGIVTLELWETILANPLKNYLPSYRFRILETATGLHVGRLNFRIGRSEQVYLFGHIGYEVYPEFRGHRFAYHACVAALELARRHNMNEIIITCNPDNIASRKTLERLGGTLLEIALVPPEHEMAKEGDREKCIFSFDPFASLHS
jgi:predicted acetyltransferase